MKLKIIQNIVCVCLIKHIFLFSAYSQSGWEIQIIGTRNNVEVKFMDENSGFIIRSDGVILKTTNQGLNWIVNSSSVFPGTISKGFIINENSFSVLAGGISYQMVYTSTNGGINWISGVDNILPIGNGFIYLRGLTFLNSVTGYVCGSDYGDLGGQFYVDGIIYKTTNSGVNWFQSLRFGFDYYDIEFIDERTGYTMYGGVIKTTNSGSSWAYAGEVFNSTFSISLPSVDTLFMSSKSGIVFRSTNQGANWTTFQTSAIDTLSKFFFLNAKTGYVVGDSGTILRTTSAGENWTSQNTGMTKNLRSIWFVNNDTGFVVGDSGIILKTLTGGMLVNVNGISEIVPDKFALHQNYPNPFNPATKVSYDLESVGYVEIKLFDVSGKYLNTLVSKNQSAGNYLVEINGSKLSSGIYFYSLYVNDVLIDSKKCILLK